MNFPALPLAAFSAAAPDAAFVGATVGFFALAVAFAWFCEKVR
jgi:hypothetical protein